MAYLGGFTAVMAKLPGVNRVTGFVAFLGWRFTYWFLQLSMRNRFMLSTDWLRGSSAPAACGSLWQLVVWSNSPLNNPTPFGSCFPVPRNFDFRP